MEVRKDGMLAKTLSTYDQFGYFYNEEVIPFGAGVMRGTDPENQCKLMVTGGSFLGVAAYRGVNVTDKREYPVISTVEVITKGHVWVKVKESVTAGDKAACGVGGTWGKSGTASYDDVNGEYETSANANEYAILWLK